MRVTTDIFARTIAMLGEKLEHMTSIEHNSLKNSACGGRVALLEDE